MYTNFEEFAISSLNGGRSNLPKVNGKLNFDSEWSQKAFAIAIELSRQGYFEMEEFRQMMISSIGKWEEDHSLNDKSWSYYSIWIAVLESLIYSRKILEKTDVTQLVDKMFHCKNASISQ